MKVYVAYLLADYSTAFFMSTDKELCEKACEGALYQTWVKEYDFSVENSFELDTD